MARKVNTTEAPIVFIVDDGVSVRRSTGRFVHSLGMGCGFFAHARREGRAAARDSYGSKNGKVEAFHGLQ
jgi:hypothetical protein